MGLNRLRPSHEFVERDVKARGFKVCNAVIHAFHQGLLRLLCPKIAFNGLLNQKSGVQFLLDANDVRRSRWDISNLSGSALAWGFSTVLDMVTPVT